MKIRQVELGKKPVTVGALTKEENIKELDQVDVFEIRIDMFSDQSLPYVLKVIKALKQNYGKPIIATIRSKEEGGHIEIDDEKRYKIFQAIVSEVDAFDVELSSDQLIKKVALLCKENKVLLIASYHNFNETPASSALDAILSSGKKNGADIVKIAARANNREDLKRLTKFTIQHSDQGIITISMGELGLISRIANPFYGSLMTYGHVGKSTAPDQFSVFETIKKLRVYDPSLK